MSNIKAIAPKVESRQVLQIKLHTPLLLPSVGVNDATITPGGPKHSGLTAELEADGVVLKVKGRVYFVPMAAIQYIEFK